MDCSKNRYQQLHNCDAASDSFQDDCLMLDFTERYETQFRNRYRNNVGRRNSCGAIMEHQPYDMQDYLNKTLTADMMYRRHSEESENSFHRWNHSNYRSRNISGNSHVGQAAGGPLSDNFVVSINCFAEILESELKKYNLLQSAGLPLVERRYPQSKNLQEIVDTVRKIAQTFAKSPFRKEICNVAAHVQLPDLSQESFSELLSGVLRDDGLTLDLLVTLLYFCAALAVRAVQQELMNVYRNIVTWTSIFFIRNFSIQNFERGVLEEAAMPSRENHHGFSAIAACAIGMVALGLYIYKHVVFHN